MRGSRWTVLGLGGWVLLGSVCCASESGPHTCTAELRSAVRVFVESPDGVAPSSVTATRTSTAQCSFDGEIDAGLALYQGVFTCWEDGGGEYVVRVKAGNLTWTQRADIAANECHTTESATLMFVLDPETAD